MLTLNFGAACTGLYTILQSQNWYYRFHFRRFELELVDSSISSFCMMTNSIWLFANYFIELMHWNESMNIVLCWIDEYIGNASSVVQLINRIWKYVGAHIAWICECLFMRLSSKNVKIWRQSLLSFVIDSLITFTLIEIQLIDRLSLAYFIVLFVSS